MATTSQFSPTPTSETYRDPLVLWHLLSLDAPTVAALWSWFVAQVCGIRLSVAGPAAMFVAVWILYAADRLLDSRLLIPVLQSRPAAAPLPDFPTLEARHRFHHRHRLQFVIGILGAALLLGTLLPRLNPDARQLFAIEGALLFAWFVLLHAAPPTLRLPKELAVGIFFAAATFIPAIARRPDLRLALAPHAVLFAALCALNCIFIHAWEHGPVVDHARTFAHSTTHFAARHLTVLTLAEIACSVLVALTALSPLRLLAVACGLSAALLLLLDTQHARLPRTVLRAAADLALLSPLLLVPVLR